MSGTQISDMTEVAFGDAPDEATFPWVVESDVGGFSNRANYRTNLLPSIREALSELDRKTWQAPTISALKALPADGTATLSDASIPGVFFWTLGDYTGQADDVNIIESDNEPLSVGAWVRQSAPSVAFEVDFAGAVIRNVSDKLTELYFSVEDFGAVGDCVPGGSGGTTGTDDTAAFNAAITKMRDMVLLYSQNMEQTDNTKRAICGKLAAPPDKFYLISDDLLPIPPGCTVEMRGAVLVCGADNIRLLWTDGGAQQFPKPGGGTLDAYGSDNMVWNLPAIDANGYAGTFVVFNTVAKTQIFGGNFFNATGSSYTCTGAFTNASANVGVTQADYDQVKVGDVIDIGVEDSAGNPYPYLVTKKEVLSPGTPLTTAYGRLVLDKTVGIATGDASFTQFTFPLVAMSLQQSDVFAPTFDEADFSFYLGKNGDGLPCTDLRIYNLSQQYCVYGAHIGQSSQMIYLIAPSWQYSSAGSEVVFDCINATVVCGRVEVLSDASADLKEIPCIVCIKGSAVTFQGQIDWAHNNTGRYMGGQFDDASAYVDGIRTFAANVPEMPDTSYAAWLRPANTGTTYLGSITGPTGPTVDGKAYTANPYAWVTDGAGGFNAAGYSASQTYRPDAVRVGLYTTLTTGTELTNAVQRASEAHARYAVRGDGNLIFGSGASAPTATFGSDGTDFYISGGVNAVRYNVGFQQVVGARGAAVADPTGGATVDAECRAQLIELLERLRATSGHGLIAE